MRDVIGLLGALSLLVLPGCWFAFGLPLSAISFRARAALAVVLAPVAVVAEFYVLRLAGLPFGATAVAIAALNIPAASLVVRRLPGVSLPRAGTIAMWSGPLLLAAAYLVLWLHDPQILANWRHNWLHADIIYLLANGQLRPEEPLLAGVRLSYPWAGHVFQGVVSFIRGTPPNSSFMLTNAVWLLAVMALTAELVKALGGRLAAQATSAALLCFGVNFAGVVGRAVLPAQVSGAYPVWGDGRYTPWLRKFGIFESTTFGIGIFAALVFLLAREDSPSREGSRTMLVAVLLVSAAVMYPILWPACAAVVGAYLLASPGRWFGSTSAFRGEFVLLSGSLGAAMLVLLGYVGMTTVDRGTDPTMGLTHPWGMKVKMVTAVVVLAPLLIGAVFSIPTLWKERRRSLLVLGMTLAQLLAMFVALDIYNTANEYKLVFVSACCLVPVASLALGRLAERLGSRAAAVPLVVAATLAYPAVTDLPRDDAAYQFRPEVDLSQFDLRLLPGEPFAELLDAVRSDTPTNAVLVSQALPFDLATPARRPMYVPLVDREPLLGLGLSPDFLLKQSRGYSGALVDRRRGTVRRLYESQEELQREQAMTQILSELGRPVVLVLERPGDSTLEGWLVQRGATSVYAGLGSAAWLIMPDRPSGSVER